MNSLKKINETAIDQSLEFTASVVVEDVQMYQSSPVTEQH